MGNSKINNLLIPQVSKLPKDKKVANNAQLEKSQNPDEFKNLLKQKVGEARVEHGINLSLHAAKRLQERDLVMDNSEFFKLKDAMNRLKQKGGQDSLVITDKAAYIVNVGSNTIVTAIDKESINENVFTKIDSTVVIN